MEIVIIGIVVGLVVTAVLWAVGTAARGRSAPDETPDRIPRTSTGVTPSADPDRPVPGSARDRTRKGQTAEGVPSPVAPDD